mgnify:CR=1 FL=1
MEDQLPTAADTNQWSTRFTHALEEQRERAQQLLQAECERIQRIEAQDGIMVARPQPPQGAAR